AVAGEDIARLGPYPAALEAREGLPEGAIAILPIATETAGAIFALASYAGSSPRLCGVTWGCEDLAAAVGAADNRGADGAYLPPFELARSLCLFAAGAAGVAGVDTVFTEFRGEAGLYGGGRGAE